MPNRNTYYEQLKELYKRIKKKRDTKVLSVEADTANNITNRFISFPIPQEESPIEDIRKVSKEYKQFIRTLIDIKTVLRCFGEILSSPVKLMDEIIKTVREKENLLNGYLEDVEKKEESKRSKWQFHFSWLNIFVVIAIFIVGFLIGRYT